MFAHLSLNIRQFIIFLNTDEDIEKCSEYEYKNYIKKKVRNKSFEECIIKLRGHDKVKHIEYDNIDEPQQYLCS